MRARFKTVEYRTLGVRRVQKGSGKKQGQRGLADLGRSRDKPCVMEPA